MHGLPNKFSGSLFNLFKKNETAFHELSLLFWECTARCNLNCLHCGSDCKSDNTSADLPFEDFLNAILPLKKNQKRDGIVISITGGEAILRKDFAENCRTLRQSGFRFGIVTNGYDYNENIHGKLTNAGMGSVSLSLDGPEDSHNWLRQDNKSFKRAVNALKLIVSEKNIVYDIITCVNKRNIDELENMKIFLLSQNVQAWRFFTISPTGRAADNDDLFLMGRQIKYLMEFIVGLRMERQIQATFSCESYLGEYEKKVRDEYFFCRAGIQIASILNDGSISACPNIDRSFVQGNIYNDDFSDVWENRFRAMRDRGWTKTGLCLNCKDYKNCSGGAMHLWNEKKDGIMTCLHRRIANMKD